MKLKVLGSGSKGNCYLLTSSKGKTLIIEAGLRNIEIKESLGFDLTSVEGLLLSHAHS